MNVPSNPKWIVPNWAAPSNVRALSTTRLGGLSAKPFDSFNLALHVGDDPAVVNRNRQLLRDEAQLPNQPVWLEQVHGREVAVAENTYSTLKADACVSFTPRNVCVVMTADCMPILLATTDGRAIAAVHAGWRGLAGGVIETAFERIRQRSAAPVVAWIGPSILQSAFEVGDDVKNAFCDIRSEFVSAFEPNHRGRWQADLVSIARRKLQLLGVESIAGGEHCTYTASSQFFSYRRDGVTGRMATLIWMDN